MRRNRITVFGSSRIKTNDSRFTDTVQLGRALGEHGWDGITGGHQGLMAAFTTGMRAGGGHVRGVTLERFPTPPDSHLSEEVRARDFFHRMQTMIEDADAYLVLPGGLGTLAELAMSWDLLAIHVLEARPLILYGKGWANVTAVLRKHLVLSVDDAFELAILCNTPSQVFEALQEVA